MPFKIPLKTEIEKYMREKKGWPESFCIYYSEKFWANYQASGWKLSNGNAMKDWQAAFCSNWQNLKYKEDIEMLAQCQKKEAPKMTGTTERDIEFMQERLLQGNVTRELFVAWYDHLKSKGVLKLPKDIIDKIRVDCGNNNDFGKELYMREFLKKNKLRVA